MKNRRRPRALTLTLPNSKQPFLKLGGHTYTLRNFSENGIGIWVKAPPPFGLTVGNRVTGEIEFEKKLYPVTLEIRHHSPGLVGLEFSQTSTELTGAFRKVLAPTVYASGLKPHRDSGSEDPEVGYPRLHYFGHGASELLIWYNAYQKMILGIQLCWLGQYVYRGLQQAPQTGFLNDETRLVGKRLSPRELLVSHPKADREILQQAAQFLTSVPPPLPGHLLWQFLETGEQIYLKLLPASEAKASEVA